MIVSANIATYVPRIESLKKMLKSVVGQFDLIRVNCNGYDWHMVERLPQYDNVTYHIMTGDKADNAKFYWLDLIETPEIFCTLDDDIQYPPDYREKIEAAVKDFGCIVSYHGRRIHGIGYNYYRGTTQFHCLNNLSTNEEVEVLGTGVMAFDTRYFHPKGLADAQDLRMADLIFALEAAKQGKQMGVLAHEHGWLKLIGNNPETIYNTEKNNTRQNELVDEIFRLRYESK